MKTLHLNLTREWFIKTYIAEKPEDYREIKEFYIPRLFNYRNQLNLVLNDKELKSFFVQAFKTNPNTNLLRHLKHFDTTTFSNGMAKNAPRFVIENKGLEIREGKPEWGAEKGKLYFVLPHGNVISSNEEAKQLLKNH